MQDVTYQIRDADGSVKHIKMPRGSSTAQIKAALAEAGTPVSDLPTINLSGGPYYPSGGARGGYGQYDDGYVSEDTNILEDGLDLVAGLGAGIFDAAGGLASAAGLIPVVSLAMDPLADVLYEGGDLIEDVFLSDRQKEMNQRMGHLVAESVANMPPLPEDVSLGEKAEYIFDYITNQGGAAGTFLAEHPTQAFQLIAQTIPSLLAGAGVGGAIGKAGQGVRGLSKLGGAGRAAIGEGVVAGGQTAGDIVRTRREEEGRTFGLGDVASLDRYAGLGAGIATAGLGRLGAALGRGTDVDILALDKISSKLSSGAAVDLTQEAVKRAPTITGTFRAAAAEGAEELLQSGQESAFGNLGRGDPLFEGVGSDAVTGAFAGGALGGGVNLRRAIGHKFSGRGGTTDQDTEFESVVPELSEEEAAAEAQQAQQEAQQAEQEAQISEQRRFREAAEAAQDNFVSEPVLQEQLELDRRAQMDDPRTDIGAQFEVFKREQNAIMPEAVERARTAFLKQIPEEQTAAEYYQALEDQRVLVKEARTQMDPAAFADMQRVSDSLAANYNTAVQENDYQTANVIEQRALGSNIEPGMWRMSKINARSGLAATAANTQPKPVAPESTPTEPAPAAQQAEVAPTQAAQEPVAQEPAPEFEGLSEAQVDAVIRGRRFGGLSVAEVATRLRDALIPDFDASKEEYAALAKAFTQKKNFSSRGRGVAPPIFSKIRAAAGLAVPKNTANMKEARRQAERIFGKNWEQDQPEFVEAIYYQDGMRRKSNGKLPIVERMESEALEAGIITPDQVSKTTSRATKKKEASDKTRRDESEKRRKLIFEANTMYPDGEWASMNPELATAIARSQFGKAEQLIKEARAAGVDGRDVKIAADSAKFQDTKGKAKKAAEKKAAEKKAEKPKPATTGKKQKALKGEYKPRNAVEKAFVEAAEAQLGENWMVDAEVAFKNLKQGKYKAADKSLAQAVEAKNRKGKKPASKPKVETKAPAKKETPKDMMGFLQDARKSLKTAKQKAVLDTVADTVENGDVDQLLDDNGIISPKAVSKALKAKGQAVSSQAVTDSIRTISKAAEKDPEGFASVVESVREKAAKAAKLDKAKASKSEQLEFDPSSAEDSGLVNRSTTSSGAEVSANPKGKTAEAAREAKLQAEFDERESQKVNEVAEQRAAEAREAFNNTIAETFRTITPKQAQAIVDTYKAVTGGDYKQLSLGQRYEVVLLMKEYDEAYIDKDTLVEELNIVAQDGGEMDNILEMMESPNGQQSGQSVAGASSSQPQGNQNRDSGDGATRPDAEGAGQGDDATTATTKKSSGAKRKTLKFSNLKDQPELDARVNDVAEAVEDFLADRLDPQRREGVIRLVDPRDGVDLNLDYTLGDALLLNNPFNTSDITSNPNSAIRIHPTHKDAAVAIFGSGSRANVEKVKGIRGATDGVTVHLVAPNLTAESAVPVLLHELGVHVGLKNQMGKEFDTLAETVRSWAKLPEGSIERDVFEAANARTAAATLRDGLSEEVASEELVAYAVEEAYTRGVRPDVATEDGYANAVKKLMADFMAFVKKFLGVGDSPTYELTATDLVSFAAGAMRGALNNTRVITLGDVDDAAASKLLNVSREGRGELGVAQTIESEIQGDSSVQLRHEWPEGVDVGPLKGITSVAAKFLDADTAMEVSFYSKDIVDDAGAPVEVFNIMVGLRAPAENLEDFYVLEPESPVGVEFALSVFSDDLAELIFDSNREKLKSPKVPQAVADIASLVTSKDGELHVKLDVGSAGVTKLMREVRGRLVLALDGVIPAISAIRVTGAGEGIRSVYYSPNSVMKFSRANDPGSKPKPKSVEERNDSLREKIRQDYGADAVKMFDFMESSGKSFADGLKFLHQFVRDVKDRLPEAGEIHQKLLDIEVTRNKIKRDVDDIAARAKTLEPKRLALVNDFIAKATLEQAWPYEPPIPDWKGKINQRFAIGFKRLTQDEQQIVKDIFAYGIQMQQRKADIASRFNLPKNFFGLSELQGPYAPLRRFGNYVAVGKSQAYTDLEKKIYEAGDQASKADREMLDLMQRNEKDYFVSFHDTLPSARAEADRLTDAGYSSVKAAGKYDTEGQSDIMNTALLEQLLGRSATLGNISPEAKESFAELLRTVYFESLEDGDARQSGATRKGIAGFEKNMLRSFIANANSEATMVASMEHNSELSELFSQARKTADIEVNQTELTEAINMLKKHHSYMLKPRNGFFSAAADRVAAFNTAYMLTSSVGYHAQNMTQPAMVTVPRVAGDYGQYNQTWKDLAKGYKIAKDMVSVDLKTRRVKVDLDKAPAKYRALLEQMENRQLLDVGIEQDLAEWETFDTGIEVVNKTGAAAREAALTLYQTARAVETFNRVSAAVAAHDAAKRNPKRTKDLEYGSPTEYAIRIVEDTQGNFSAMDAPLLIKWAPKLVLQYRKYQIMMAWAYVEAFKKSFWGKNAEQKAAGRRVLGAMLAHGALMSGIKGVPLVGSVAWVFMALSGDDDEEPQDVERWIRDNMGEDMANIVSRGVPAAFGMDMSTKLSQSGIFHPAPYADFSVDDGVEGFLAQLAGPSVTTANNFFRAAQFAKKGDGLRAVEMAMPKGLRTAMEATRISSKGYQLPNGDVVISPDEFGAELTLDALGLNSTKLNSIKWTLSQQYELREWSRNRSGEIRREYVKAWKRRDRGRLRKLQKEWVDLQKRKIKLNKFFGGSASELTVQPISDLIKEPQRALRRENKNQRRLDNRPNQ